MNQNTNSPDAQARECQRNGPGRKAPPTANRTAASATPGPRNCATPNHEGQIEDKNGNGTVAVARAKPIRDKVENTVLRALLRAHRDQLQTKALINAMTRIEKRIPTGRLAKAP